MKYYEVEGLVREKALWEDICAVKRLADARVRAALARKQAYYSKVRIARCERKIVK